VSRDPTADRILARRARFVALALAAVGCHEGEAAPSNQSVVLPPPPDAGTTASAVDAGETHAVIVEAGADPTDISPATKERYARHAAQMAGLRNDIARLTETIAKAPAFSSATTASWQELTYQVQVLYQAIGYMAIYCPAKRPETDTFLAQVEKDREALRGEVDGVKKKATARLADKTMSGDARFDLLVQQYNNSHPRPCLSIACDSW
jgi:hypothetical protein